MNDKPQEPIEPTPESEDDAEGHMLGAAIAMSGVLSPRSRDPQWAKEDALPLDEPKGRPQKSDKSPGSGKTSDR
jgi:hypothetical protein